MRKRARFGMGYLAKSDIFRGMTVLENLSRYLRAHEPTAAQRTNKARELIERLVSGTRLKIWPRLARVANAVDSKLRAMACNLVLLR